MYNNTGCIIAHFANTCMCGDGPHKERQLFLWNHSSVQFTADNNNMWKVGLLELAFALSTVQSIYEQVKGLSNGTHIRSLQRGGQKRTKIIGSFVVDPTVVTSLSWSKVKVLYGTTSSMGSMRMHLKDYYQVWVYLHSVSWTGPENSPEVYWNVSTLSNSVFGQILRNL